MKTKTVFLVLCALVALIVPARAETDMDYSGRIDPVTGSPYGRAETASSGRVALSDTMYYDFDAHDFVYPLPDARGDLHASVADGMVTTNTVRLTVPVDSGVTVYHDGEQYTGDLSVINERGEYAVAAGPETGAARLLTFTIQGASTRGLTYFNVPDGFFLTGVTYGEGEEAWEYPAEDRYSVALRDEGPYHIEYECAATNIVYSLDTIIDRTPPRLAFDGEIDEDGNVHSALQFTGMEKGDYISLTHDGEPVEHVELNGDLSGGTIYDSGSYVMQVFDDAGNMTQYEFTILTYFNTQSWVFVVLVMLVLVGTAAYIVIQRRKLEFG